MTKIVFKIFLIIAFYAQLSACSNEEELVTITPAPNEPPAFLSTRSVVFGAGLNAVVKELGPPWTQLSFNFENNSTEAVSIVALSFEVSDPLTGNTNIITLSNIFDDGDLVLTTIKPTADFNCDGFVTDDDASLTEPSTDCPLDDIRQVFENNPLYLENIVRGTGGSDNETISSQYRGLSFSIIARFEGWIGTPQLPLRNFYQEVFFTLKAN